ncbi:hypothetical protein [Microvirga terricola]|uniref:Uncharacterized protein n=1 Tax=Microvirga terricola TaxID=2719797 RepID=A0ABX0VAK8_9HYPH|nr:hypothetical protein [Microvirga terricola]NIX76884.1 hypothetical protein [Microvirga terricola]
MSERLFYWFFKMASTVEVPADLKQRAHDHYFHRRSVTIPDIAMFIGVSETRFRRLRETWGWPPRREALAQAGKGGATDATAEPAEGERAIDDRTNSALSLREAALSLAQVTRRRIEALVRDQRSGRRTDHDKAARTLASLAKTLTTAQALLEQEDTKDDIEPKNEPHRSINDLRDELARHLERIVAEQEAEGSNGCVV